MESVTDIINAISRSFERYWKYDGWHNRYLISAWIFLIAPLNSNTSNVFCSDYNDYFWFINWFDSSGKLL